MLFQLVSSHGMLAILEVLEGKCSRDVLMKLLHIINLVRHLYQITTLLTCALVAGHKRSWSVGEFLSHWWHSCNDG